MEIRLDQIAKSFDKKQVIQPTTMTIQNGSFTTLLGPSGCGKTTLLNIICGSLPVEGGKVFFKDQDITRMTEFKRADKVGRVFQDPKKGTCDELTILENMALADNKHKAYGLTRGVNKRRMDYYRTLLETCGMGLEDRLNVKAGTLSGGQRQALALILANMTDIELLILDEHTAALDPKSSETVMRITDKLVKEKQVTSLMVTHNLRFALEYGNRLVMMHEGRCVLDVSGEEKQKLEIDALLKVFNEISVECGN